MTVTVATLRESILDAIRTAIPSYNVHGGTPYGVDIRADDPALMSKGRLRAVFVGEAMPDAVHRVGGTHDLSARVRVEMYREAEAVATVSVAARSAFLRRFCHRAELIARFFKLCTEV